MTIIALGHEVVNECLQATEQGTVVLDPVNLHTRLFPPHRINGNKLRRHRAVVIHFDQPDPARSALVRVTPLCVAGIDHPWRRSPQDGAGVHVPKRPVVIPSRGQFLNGARRVGFVPGVRADIGVEHPDGDTTRLGSRELRHQAAPDLACWIADAADHRTGG
jgi:hypothetical protein